MADKDGSIKEKEADEEEDEHEEGEISDEDLPPVADAASEEDGKDTEEKEGGSTDAEGGAYGSASLSTSRRIDDTAEIHKAEARLGQSGAETHKPEARLGQAGAETRKAEARSGQSGAKPADGFRVSDMDATIKNESGGDSLRNTWGVSGYSLYHLAWAQGVSGRGSFTSGADSPTIDAPTTSKPLSERLSGLGDSGSWGTEKNYRRLAKSSSRDSDFYGRGGGRGAEEGDEELSPVRENGSSGGEIRTSERGRRAREASWSEREVGSRSFRRSGSVLSRLGKIDRDSMEDEDYSTGGRGVGVGDEKRLRKQRSASNSSMERAGLPDKDSVKASSGGDGKVDVEEKEEGELEEGEIDLGSSPEDSPASPSKDSKLSKQRSSVSTTATEYWSKEKSYSKAGSGVKARLRPSAEDYSNRRHRQKRLFTAGDLVRNVTVKDAQKSFVDVCNRLLKALRILDELQTLPPGDAAISQEGRTEGQQPREVTALARQAFQGIRAVYAVRNTASGREQEQERDRNIFPRLLELANGYCQKLFSPKQARELEGMMHAVANSARLTRGSRESSSQHREQQLPPAPKTLGKNQNPSDPLAGKRGNNRTTSVGELSTTSETKEAERMLVFDEAAALAAAALAYAQNPENAARALSLHGKKNNLSISAPNVGADVWKWPSGLVSDNQSTKSLILPTSNGYNTLLGRYPNWTAADQRGHADAHAQAPSQLGDSNREASLPLGFNKGPGSYGIPHAVWDNLNRSQFAAAFPSPMQADSILNTPQGKPWTVQQPEGNAAIPAAYMRQLSADFLANPNVQRIPVVDDDFERMPSPTPDEGEETKRNSKPSEPALVQDNDTIKNPVTVMAPIRNLTRSYSVDQQGFVSDSKISNETSEELTPKQIILSTTSSTISDNLYPLPQKGAFRSRDPRRRTQGLSLDMTSMPRLDQVFQEALTTEAFRGNSNKRQLVLETDERQDADGVKRLKRQTESAIYTNGSLRESYRTSSATGGWLDDSAESPSGSGLEDTAMDLEDEGPSVVQDTPQGADPNFNANGSSQQGFSTLLNGVVAKKSTTEVGQQAIVEIGSRAGMRPRDPRRVLVDGQGERDLGSSVEKMHTDNSGVIILRKPGEGVVSNSDSTQAGNPQFDKVAVTVTSRFTGKGVETAATTSSNSSLQPNGQIVVKSVSNVVERADMGMEHAASENSGALGEPADPSEFAVNLKPITGPRKPKGPSSQWGASQVHPGLELLLGDLTEEERKSVQLERQRRMAEQDRMFSAGKLCLVLDLDHTLLNSAKFSEIEPEWDQRLRGAEIAEKNRIGRDGEGRRELYRFPHMSMWTKLRPGIWKFLARASQLYELHVYTMGNKVYATEMAKVLDPTGKLFAGRVISKGDDGDGDDLLPKSKDLDGVLGMESAVVIIDDSARVWPHHSENLIVVERYMYFPCSRRQFGLTGPSLLEVGHDERESDGMLASALGVIARIHENFFKNPRLREVDVREILADQKRQVLGRCKVVFSRVFPVGEAEPHRHPLWRTAEQFGAVCTGGLDEEVTHVVAISLGTDKVNWALETGRHVVRPAWIEASTILYRRANERDFPVLPQ